jgi:hypothetical protein
MLKLQNLQANKSYSPLKCSIIVTTTTKQMDWFDDNQVEEFYPADFVEELNEELFDEDTDNKTFQKLLNSNYDY